MWSLVDTAARKHVHQEELLLMRIMESLAPLDGSATSNYRRDDRSAIHRVQDEARRCGASQDGRGQSVLGQHG